MEKLLSCETVLLIRFMIVTMIVAIIQATGHIVLGTIILFGEQLQDQCYLAIKECILKLVQ